MYKVTTIMASYLGRYDGCASDRSEGFRRAVSSWAKQAHPKRELIIVSDGCDETMKIYEKEFSKIQDILCFKIPKQLIFSGDVRQAGLEKATGDVITYLDTDDYIQPSHISQVDSAMRQHELDWCYYADWLKITKEYLQQRNPCPTVLGRIGTSNIAHLRSMKSNWIGCDGYGHDFTFIQRLKKESKNYDQIFGCGYVVCHTKNGLDN